MNYIYSDFSRNDSQRWFSKERSQNGLRFAVENCPIESPTYVLTYIYVAFSSVMIPYTTSVAIMSCWPSVSQVAKPGLDDKHEWRHTWPLRKYGPFSQQFCEPPYVSRKILFFFSSTRWFMTTSLKIPHPRAMQESSNDAISWLLLDNGAQHPLYSLYTWDTAMSCCIPRKASSKLTHQLPFVA